VPILERLSGLKLDADFSVGYSPERINPGDKQHRLPDIRKVTSGSSDQAAARIDALYARIITAGTYRAESIRVAEAAKVIENTQRDLNIALVNELAVIFGQLGIDTEAVLQAAGTKWNFLPFRPGLVGGHCIGVDPYYLTYKAEAIGYHPHIILAGRRLNDQMGVHVVGQTIREMLRRRIHVNGSRVLVLGLAFKENCPDLRNTRVVDVVAEFRSVGAEVDVYDPWVAADEAEKEYGLNLIQALPEATYDAIILAVAHDQFREMGAARLRVLGKPEHVLYDLKYVLAAGESDLRL
jgi:UDP-N-acetyl-D-galactosamine dehydrogenase